MAVVRFEVERRVPIGAGHEWGEAGAYERIDARAWLEVDPADPANAVICNLESAPRNAAGRVAFSTPVRILKPVDMARGNGKIWYGINNRGAALGPSLRCYPMGPVKRDPEAVANLGADNVLLREGYAVVDAGWHADAPDDPALLVPDFPIAVHADGSPITGPLRVEFSLALAEPGPTGYSIPLSWSSLGQWRPYAAADTDTSTCRLTVRDRWDGPAEEIAPDRWAFGRCSEGPDSFEATATDITLFDGFDQHRIYELTYQAKDPIVMGLAYAVTRDVGAFLRFDTHDAAGNANPLAHGGEGTGIRRAYVSGNSSTGMYLREFLYLGFNGDEAGRRVFDAATLYSAGAYRLFANVQFAHPTFFSTQDWHRDYTANAVFPFAYAVTTDPVSGQTDGILKRPETDPLVIQIDEELLFWQWKASLNVVDGHGAPVPVPDTVRLYCQNGFGHVGATGLCSAPLPPGITRHATPDQATSITITPRALVRVIDDWADRGIAPPPSNYPRIGDGSLVPAEDYPASFPAIPGVTPPTVVNPLTTLDYGPGFDATGGVQTILPPVPGAPYALFLPRPSADGHGAAGIDTIWTRAPTGTNVGWNLRTGAREGELAHLWGSFIPFAATRAEREASGDPRLSLEERYGDRDGFVAAVRAASDALVADRFLLAEDAAMFVRAAAESALFDG